jgi:hypothetical protein
MNQAMLATRDFSCPSCNARLTPPGQGLIKCPGCAWTGEVYLFRARPVTVDAGEAALPEDAACIHHPRKRATAVCAGTGDYICALCAVEIGGQTFGAAYLAAGGKDKAAQAFDRTIPRPDNQIATYLICLFVPYVNFILIPFAFIWIPHAFFLYFKALRLRRENPLFARLMSRSRVILLPILLGIVSALWAIGVIALTHAIMEGEL